MYKEKNKIFKNKNKKRVYIIIECDNMKRALITGITGFVGSHLADRLVDTDTSQVWVKRWKL